MIPKIIHYVWLGGGEKSEKIKRCIESWKKYLPDYEIKEWNESNFDLNLCDFTRQSYDKKMYAFTSDVIRLYALYTEGGIYMDTDVEVYKPLDEFLNDEAFTGFEDTDYPATATMRSRKRKSSYQIDAGFLLLYRFQDIRPLDRIYNKPRNKHLHLFKHFAECLESIENKKTQHKRLNTLQYIRKATFLHRTRDTHTIRSQGAGANEIYKSKHNNTNLYDP